MKFILVELYAGVRYIHNECVDYVGALNSKNVDCTFSIDIFYGRLSHTRGGCFIEV